MSRASLSATGRRLSGNTCRLRLPSRSWKGGWRRARREADELAVWGDFSPEAVKNLRRMEWCCAFFSVYDSGFAAVRRAAGDAIIVEPVAEREGRTYFVVVAPDGGEIPFDAWEQKRTGNDRCRKTPGDSGHGAQMDELRAVMARAYASRDAIEAHGERLRERLDFSRAAGSGRRGSGEPARYHGGLGHAGDFGAGGRAVGGISGCRLFQGRSLRRRTILPSF